MKVDKNILLWLAFATIAGMGGLGLWLIPVAREIGTLNFLAGFSPIYLQMLTGLATGILIAIVGWFIVSLPFFAREREYYAGFVKPFQLNIIEIIFISICAGVGEELLFRGAIQPYLGIWLTSIVFVILHGYINPRKPNVNVYGVFMILSIALIGFLTEQIGILSSMIAHTVIDIYLLYKLTNT